MLKVRIRTPGALFPTARGKRSVTGWFHPELFDGNGRCVWLKRWTLVSIKGWELYLHHWLNDDWSTHHHDHSRSMLSIGVWGRYTEHVLDQPPRRWRAPWVRWFPAAHRHFITLDTSTVWTLVIAAPQSRRSGFWLNGHRVGTAEYLLSPAADQQKRC